MNPTGPRTEQGKAVSSMNALKTALTGRTVLLPADDRDRYQQHLTHYFDLWKPEGEHECTLVQLLADTWWRLQRIPQLEAALWANGRNKFFDLEERFIELETFLVYERQFRNLALQERRLSNYAARLKAELEQTQAARTQPEPEVKRPSTSARPRPAAVPQPENQFEFSTDPKGAVTPPHSPDLEASRRSPERPPR